MFSKKRMANLFVLWANSSVTTLYEAYKYPSGKKISAYEIIRQDKHNRGIAVMTATCHFFSVGYVREEDGKLWFVYNTGRTIYTLLLSDNQAWLDMAYEHLSAIQEWFDMTYEHLKVLGNEQ